MIDEIIDGGIKAARDTIETCRIIETRMVDNYVLALPEDGSVMHKNGVYPFGIILANVERTRDRAEIEKFRKHLIEMNPDNSVVARLEIMSWKKAARIQRGVAERLIEQFEALKKGPAS